MRMREMQIFAHIANMRRCASEIIGTWPSLLDAIVFDFAVIVFVNVFAYWVNASLVLRGWIICRLTMHTTQRKEST